MQASTQISTHQKQETNQFCYDPQAIQFRNPKTKTISLGALKTEIDRRLIKILTMLGDSCNIKSKQQWIINQQQQKQEIQQYISQDREGSQTSNQKQNSKFVSLFEPNDLDQEASETNSNESETKRTIQQMSIYKIFGFKNSSNCEDNELDNIFTVEQEKTDYKSSLNLNFTGTLQNITNKNFNRSSNTDRDHKNKYETDNTILSFSKSRLQDPIYKQNCKGEKSLTKNFNSDNKSAKISIRNLLERNGHDTDNKTPLMRSPKKNDHNRSYMLTSRSSARKTIYGKSTHKKENILRSPIVKNQTMEKMRQFVSVFNDKKMRKQSVGNNVRMNMLKRIVAKYPQIMKSSIVCS